MLTKAISIILLTLPAYGFPEELPRYELVTQFRRNEGPILFYGAHKIDRVSGEVKYCIARFDPQTKKALIAGCSVRISKPNSPDLRQNRTSLGGEEAGPFSYQMLGFINISTGEVSVCWIAFDICTVLND